MKKTIFIAAALLAASCAAWNLYTRSRWGRFETYMCSETARPFFKASPSPDGLLARPGRDSFSEVFSSAAGDRVEIVNCGMGAYASSRILGVFSETLEYSPDLVILLSGNNEVGPRIEACPDAAGFFRSGRRWLRAAFFSFGRGWLGGLAEETARTHEARLERMAALADGVHWHRRHDKTAAMTARRVSCLPGQRNRGRRPATC